MVFTILLADPGGRPDKDEHLIQELVDGGQLKQALTVCEKRLKKRPTRILQINHAFLLLSSPDAPRRQQGSVALLQMLSATPPMSELRVLVAIEEFSREHWKDGKDEVSKMWERAATVSSADETFFDTWLSVMFQKPDYRGSQKAAMLWSRAFPKKREPWIWTIIFNFLASTDPSLARKERDLYAMLTYRTLAKAAADVPVSGMNGETNGLVPPTKFLSTTEELLFTLQVYRSQGKDREALQLLEDEQRTGLHSELGRGSWDVVVHKLELLALCDKWDSLLELCQNLLRDALPRTSEVTDSTHASSFGILGDDLQVWRSLISAGAKIEVSTASDTARLLVRAGMDVNSMNAWQAHMLLQKVAQESDPNFLLAVQTYYEKYQSRDSCYEDVRAFTSTFSQAAAESFLYRATAILDIRQGIPVDARYIYRAINALKQKYTLQVSTSRGTNLRSELSAFAIQCIKVYKESLDIEGNRAITDRHPGDDAAILAAMALIRAAHLGEESAIYQAYTVLYHASRHSAHNYDILLLLICTTKLLGCMSLSFEHYQKLDIKNIQVFTTLWMIFERASTIHPHAFAAGSGLKDSVLELEFALQKRQSITRKAQASALDALKEGSFPAIYEGIQLSRKLRNADSKLLHLVEFDRIMNQRLEKETTKLSLQHDWQAFQEELQKIDLGSICYTTESDRSTLPNYEPANQPSFSEYLRIGPIPSKTWYQAQQIISRAYLLLDTKTAVSENPFAGSLSNSTAAEEDQSSSLTAVEECHFAIASFISMHTAEILAKKKLPKTSVDELDSFFSTTVKQHIENTQAFASNLAAGQVTMLPTRSYPRMESQAQTGVKMDSTYPDWSLFHELYSRIEVVRMVLKFMKLCIDTNAKHKIASPGWLQPEVKAFDSSARRIRHDFETGCMNWHAKLGMSEAREALATKIGGGDKSGGLVGEALLEAFGRDKLMEASTLLLASWREALLGHKHVQHA